MKAFATLLVGVLLALLTIWALPILKGYVLVRAGGWAIEMNVLVFVVLLLAIYALLRLGIWAWNLPGNVVLRFFQARASAQMEVGMLALSEGNWRKAEKALTKAAKNSDRPAMSYLGAAQAAHRSGGGERAEEYLDQAVQDGRAKDSVVITRAQLLLASNQPEEALAALSKVRRGKETRPRVLQLLARCYERLDHWQDLAELVPALSKTEIITAEQGQDITRRATLQQLDGAADSGELGSLWRKLDRFSRRDYQFLAAFVANATKLGAGDAAEKELLTALKKNWSEPLMKLYSELPAPGASLAQAEKWLSSHPDSAALHLLTARLCAQGEIWGKAREHYETSVRLNPDPVAFAELAELKAREGDSQGALDDYRRALGKAREELPAAPPQLEHP